RRPRCSARCVPLAPPHPSRGRSPPPVRTRSPRSRWTRTSSTSRPSSGVRGRATSRPSLEAGEVHVAPDVEVVSELDGPRASRRQLGLPGEHAVVACELVAGRGPLVDADLHLLHLGDGDTIRDLEEQLLTAGIAGLEGVAVLDPTAAALGLLLRHSADTD